jgi:AbrB family looped-hinge helix DNA binding protein
MKLAESRLTTQGQVSVPADVRKRLGLAPGSIIEWDAQGDHVVVRRRHRFSSADVHATLFLEGRPRARSLKDLKTGIRSDVAKRHARH